MLERALCHHHQNRWEKIILWNDVDLSNTVLQTWRCIEALLVAHDVLTPVLLAFHFICQPSEHLVCSSALMISDFCLLEFINFPLYDDVASTLVKHHTDKPWLSYALNLLVFWWELLWCISDRRDQIKQALLCSFHHNQALWRRKMSLNALQIYCASYQPAATSTNYKSLSASNKNTGVFMWGLGGQTKD